MRVFVHIYEELFSENIMSDLWIGAYGVLEKSSPYIYIYIYIYMLYSPLWEYKQGNYQLLVYLWVSHSLPDIHYHNT